MASASVKDERSTKTYVFLHLNTTCLPEGENECKITEICMMAVNRESFNVRLEYDQNVRPILPRVTNKLVLFINPKADITETAMEISELTNERLSQQKSFRKCTSSSIRSFLDHLKKPVCLIANYGKGFDFPVLKEELETIDAFNDYFANMYCADSLDALRAVATKRVAGGVDDTRPILKRSRTEQQPPKEKATASSLKKTSSFIPNSFSAQNPSFGVREYFQEMFGQKPEDAHTAEGYCTALVNIVHNTPGFFEWVDKNKSKMISI